MKIVVAICTANREAYLSQILERLKRIDLRGLEQDQVSILIVDNRPGGAVLGQCEQVRPHLPVPIEVVEEPVPGISEARNRAVGAALADGADLLAFLDDDDLPDPDWLVQLVVRQRETGALVVAGNRRKLAPGAAGAQSGGQGTMMDGMTELWKPSGLPELISTSNVLIGAPLLTRMAAAGPVFDPVFSAMGGEDADFFMRARQLGAPFAAAPASLIDFRTEGARGTLLGRMVRKFKAGCGQAHLARRHLDPAALAWWVGGLCWRTLRDVVLVLPDFLRHGTRGEGLAKLWGALGMWFGLFGGRYRYYTGSGLSE
jgi:glycosyltransferase involved in cell wall biosynthesis